MASFTEIAVITLKYFLWPGLLIFISILLMFDTGVFRRFRYLKITLMLSLLLVAGHLLAIPWYFIPDNVLLIIIAILVLSGILVPLIGNPFDIARYDLTRHITPLVDDIEEYVLLIYRHARRVIILLVGSTVVVIGIAMIVTPAPAILVIPIGLSILAIEFAWARRWLMHFRKTADELQQKILEKIKLSGDKKP